MSTRQIAIIDSGGANIASLQFALQRLGEEAPVTSDANAIKQASHVILPGVGAARNGMQTLREHDLIDVIRDLSQPVLGICLGMQLLAEGSEEENVECLGILPGVARKLPGSPECPVPNMGWCTIRSNGEHALLAGIDDDSYFYFVHSYALSVNEQTIASACHAQAFAAIVAQNNFVATQFHPERSSKLGAQFLSNFLSWTP
jgi:glutamine amidotransferase